MPQNVGLIDRIVRVIAGVALIAATLMDTLPAWGWIGVIPLTTGLLSWCPAYTLLGIRTCKSA